MLMCVMSAGAQETGKAWWGYWNTSMPLSNEVLLNDVVNDLGVRVTAANNALLRNTGIQGVRFYISDKTSVEKAWVWVSTTAFNGNPLAADKYVKEIDLSLLKDMTHDGQPTEVPFDSVITLMNSSRYANAYVGYTVRMGGSTPCYAMAAGKSTRVNMNAAYVGWMQYESSYGPLALQLLVGGQDIAANGIAVSAIDKSIVKAGTEEQATLTLINNGTQPIKHFDYQVSIDGTAQAEQHVALEKEIAELELKFAQPITISLPAQAKRYACKVEITKVNGQPNGSSTAALEGELTALTQMPVKRTVMEELTGTWCPNCPRGLVGLRLLEEQFGDRFIGIAIHDDDPMELELYNKSAFVKSVSQQMGGRPSCSIDRTVNCDPYMGIGNEMHFNADFVVGELLKQPATADVEIQAQWTDEAQTSITLDAMTTFRYSAESNPYALMLVLTADSLTGDTDKWLQVNKLSGSTEYDADLTEFTQGERYMKLAYNHVPVFADGVEKGIAGSIAPTLTADETQHYQRTIDMTTNTIMQDKNRLHAIAMLIDSSTGQVVNAAKAHVTAYNAQGISRVNTATTSVNRCYDLQGRRVDGRQKGIVIQRMTDGSVRKVRLLTP